MQNLTISHRATLEEQLPESPRLPSGFRCQGLVPVDLAENTPVRTDCFPKEISTPFELASKNGAIPGDYPPNIARSEYSLGNQDPDFSQGIKISATGEVKDPATFFSALNGTIAQLAGYKASIGHTTLDSLIDDVISKSIDSGRPISQLVIQTHGFHSAITLGGNDYDLSSPQVHEQFARLAPYMAPNSEIEIRACNVGAELDGSVADKRRQGLQRLANLVGAAIEVSPNLQNPKTSSWDGQVVRFEPQ
jgi:hypothetical protein